MIKLITVLLCAMTFSISAFGQDLETDLKKSFKKFNVVKIDNQDALKKAKLKIPFQIQTSENNFQFILRLNDIRSEDYTAEYTDSDGRHKLPKGEAFTYKSTLIGEKNSIVALTIDGTKTEGYLATEHEGFFMESAKKYSSHAND